MKAFKQNHLLKAAMATTLLIGCCSVTASEEVNTSSASVVKQNNTIGEKMDDTSITTKVKMALMMHRSTGVLRTSVTTENGIVTIGGMAKNSAEKDLVTKLVEDIQGVKSVINNMVVE